MSEAGYRHHYLCPECRKREEDRTIAPRPRQWTVICTRCDFEAVPYRYTNFVGDDLLKTRCTYAPPPEGIVRSPDASSDEFVPHGVAVGIMAMRFCKTCGAHNGMHYGACTGEPTATTATDLEPGIFHQFPDGSSRYTAPDFETPEIEAVLLPSKPGVSIEFTPVHYQGTVEEELAIALDAIDDVMSYDKGMGEEEWVEFCNKLLPYMKAHGRQQYSAGWS